MSDRRIVLLGPQPPRPTLGSVIHDLDVSGPVAVITAGWQEWEGDLAGVRSQLHGREVLPLSLYQRADEAWDRDPELREAHRKVQEDLRGLRELYARQLDRAADAWMELLDSDGPGHLVEPERDRALEAIQRLDDHHLARIAEIRQGFVQRMEPLRRPSLARHREEIATLLDRASTVVVEGGHAAVLHNRIVLFGVEGLLDRHTLVGCAAGAMVLCSRIVLYNDQPAIGRGNAEVGLTGLGLVPGIVALPDATSRLRLDDPRRMRRLALRLAPDRCAVLDPGDRLDWDGEEIRATGSRTVREDGHLVPWSRAA